MKKCYPRNRKTLHGIEQTETESLSADEYEFFSCCDNSSKKPWIFGYHFLDQKSAPSIGILLYPLLLQYPIK